MFGFLNINKPAGMTSRDVVNQITRLLRDHSSKSSPSPKKVKAGHAGTLDPLATGVLVIAIGKATRLIQHVQSHRKTYVANFQLDVSSPSDDSETETTSVDPPVKPSREMIDAELPNFVGEILQKPPEYSAINIKGQRAYKLARQGIEFEIKAKKVTIHKLQILDYKYPNLVVKVVCGSGTYIRSLGRDLARKMESEAIMTHLERTAIGPFKLDDALALDELTSESTVKHLVSPLAALGRIERRTITEQEVEELKYGRFINREATDPDELAAVNPDNQLVAILTATEQGYKPSINFL